MAQRSLLQPSAPASAAPGPAILAKGFRPFFLLAALAQVLLTPVWVIALRGHLNLNAHFVATYWHAHEMLFGFTLAVIAGFLLTAVGNWTSRETAVGPPLAALVVLWLLGRVAIALAQFLPKPLVAALDLAFLPALAFACARPIVLTDNRRNYQFLGMLGLLFLANLTMHLDAIGVWPGQVRRGAWLATWVVVTMIVVMTARVVPMFTRNATGLSTIRNVPWLDRAALASVMLVGVADVAGFDERLIGFAAPVAGLIVLGRAATWGGLSTLRLPILWILHVGHAFVGLGLALRGLAAFVPLLSQSAALHAFTAGAIGCSTLGMMARVSLGHTGRMLAVRPSIAVAFGMLIVATLVRVFGPLGGSVAHRHSMTTAGSLFALAFLVFFVVYLPSLTSPRVDGRPG